MGRFYRKQETMKSRNMELDIDKGWRADPRSPPWLKAPQRHAPIYLSPTSSNSWLGDVESPPFAVFLPDLETPRRPTPC